MQSGPIGSVRAAPCAQRRVVRKKSRTSGMADLICSPTIYAGGVSLYGSLITFYAYG